MLGQRDYSVFGQEGLHWRTRKDIGDLRLAKCSTLYSAVFNNVHSYISWGLNFVGSPGHEIYAPRKFNTRNFCPTKISTITVYMLSVLMTARCFSCYWPGLSVKRAQYMDRSVSIGRIVSGNDIGGMYILWIT